MTAQIVDIVFFILCFVLSSMILHSHQHRRKSDLHKQKALILLAGTSFLYTIVLMVAIAKHTTVKEYLGGLYIWHSALEALVVVFFAAWYLAKRNDDPSGDWLRLIFYRNYADRSKKDNGKTQIPS